MKRLAILILLLSTAFAAAEAQNIATRERAPKIKPRYHRWLDDAAPRQTEYTYIEFVHSTSEPCIESCRKIRRYIDGTDRPFRVIFITCEKPAHIDSRLHECAGEYVGTIVDEEGRIFDDFGVRYVPFGVLMDSKRRVLWFGNPITTDNDFFRKITE